jgi:uncharacterized membrane protein YhaH (DUF805 family)
MNIATATRHTGDFSVDQEPSQHPGTGPRDSKPPRLARAGLWLLPVYASMLALSTLSHQPSFRSDFPGYARYVTSETFLASHLVLTIGGAALGSIGVLSAVIYLARGRARATGYLGAALTVAANIASTSVFGAAAFAQPAIGRAYLKGMEGIVDLNADVYGPTLDAMAGTGILLFILGGIVLGTAIARTSRRLRWIGLVYVVAFVAFLVTGVFFPLGQTVSAATLALASAAAAWRLPRETSA